MVYVIILTINTLASGRFCEFPRKKKTKHTWLCVGISPLRYRLQTWSKCQKTWQVF